MPGGPTSGQLAIAKYTPRASKRINSRPEDGARNQSPMRLLGTYEFVGETAARSRSTSTAIPVTRSTPAIVQQARLTTLLSADGTSQTEATFQLRTKASYLEVKLPDKGVAVVGRAGRHAAEAAEAGQGLPDRPAAQCDRGGEESATGIRSAR